MAFKCEDCPYCAFHDVEPAICDDCEDGSEFEPDDEDSLHLAPKQTQGIREDWAVIVNITKNGPSKARLVFDDEAEKVAA